MEAMGTFCWQIRDLQEVTGEGENGSGVWAASELRRRGVGEARNRAEEVTRVFCAERICPQTECICRKSNGGQEKRLSFVSVAQKPRRTLNTSSTILLLQCDPGFALAARWQNPRTRQIYPTPRSTSGLATVNEAAQVPETDLVSISCSAFKPILCSILKVWCVATHIRTPSSVF